MDVNDQMQLLQDKKQNYLNRVDRNNQRLRELEEAYQSLSKFKNVLGTETSGITDVVARQRELVSQLRSISHCRTAQKYEAGMQDVLNNIGVSLLCGAMQLVAANVNSTLNRYMNEIIDLETEISTYESRIDEIEQELYTGGMS